MSTLTNSSSPNQAPAPTTDSSVERNNSVSVNQPDGKISAPDRASLREFIARQLALSAASSPNNLQPGAQLVPSPSASAIGIIKQDSPVTQDLLTQNTSLRPGIGYSEHQSVVGQTRAANPFASADTSSNWFLSRTAAPAKSSEATATSPKDVALTSGYGTTAPQSSPPTETLAVNASHKDISQALEAALAKLSADKTAPTSNSITIDINLPGTNQGSAISPHLATTTQPSLELTATNSNNLSPQQHTQITLELSKQIPPQSPESGPQIQGSPQFSLELPPQTQQHIEQSHNHRVEQIRIIQQITAAEVDPIPTPSLIENSRNETATSHPRHESTTLAIEKLRESVLDKFIAMGSQIETYSSERARVTPVQPSADSLIQGRSNITKIDPIRHDARPSLELRHADRSGDSQATYRSILQGTTPVLSATHGAVASPLISLGDIFKRLQAFSQRSSNVQLMRRMDTALERSCLALATGAAIGVVGVEILVKTANQALLHLLRIAKASSRDSLEQSEAMLESDLVQELENYLINDALQPSAQSIVADVSGVLLDKESNLALANLLIGSKELGSTLTDEHGVFLFSNVRVGTYYTLAFYKPFCALSPASISGQSGYEAHHTIQVTVTPIARD